MRERLIVGPILIALVIGLAWLDDVLDRSLAQGWWPTPLAEAGTLPPGLIIVPLLVIIIALACGELQSMLASKGVRVGRFTLVTSALLGLACWLLPLLPYAWAGARAISPTLAAASLAFGMASYLRRKSPEGVLAATGASLIAFVYLGLLPGFLLGIRVESGVAVLVWTVLVVKSCDIGALFTGKAIGRHKLIPWLSPGKTWEGLIGGMATSAVIAFVGAYGLAAVGSAPAWPWPAFALAGALAGGLGQLGDLVKSSFKRDAAIKDSGRIIPGMGGVIDVIDSPMFVAPFAYWAFLLTDR